MARFFIDRPVLAWVVAIIIMLAGGLSIARLPVSQYPAIAPPSVTINANYPGASAKTVEDSVTQIIEQNMKGLDHLLYMSATSDSNGQVEVVLTFQNGTDPDIAQVQVQNKLQLATPSLPQIVQQQGISVSKSNPGFLMVVGFVSEDGSLQGDDISDFVTARVVDPISRVGGVGKIEVFGSKYAMRIWLDPDKLNTYKLASDDVITALRARNQQVTVGQLGGAPALKGQRINAPISAQERLQTPEQFRDIVIRSNNDGSVLTLGDVARVELGLEDYNFVSRFNGKPATGIAVSLATGANALATATRVEDMLKQIQSSFPPGVKWVVAFDTTPFVKVSIKGVVKTLLEAIALVFLVMYLFLQNFRATLIPTIAVPVVLLGTLGLLAALGYSINMLTMFAMVLAIGLLVDDAIVVVENVERIMSEEGLSPLDATHKSMGQITSALVGIAMVLSAVFVPMAFLDGSTGVIYRQFSVTIVASMALSVLVAIVLTPALCATMLKPIAKGQHAATSGFFGWFNRKFDQGNQRYQQMVRGMLGRRMRSVLLFACLVVAMLMIFLRLPTSFLPQEDQGQLFAMVSAPVGATQERTDQVVRTIEQHFLEAEKDSVESLFTVQGFSFAGVGQNTAMAFIQLKDWKVRHGSELGVEAVANRATAAFANIKDALVFAFAPPAVQDLGTSNGFAFYLKDNAGLGHEALTEARNQLLEAAGKSKLLANMRPNGQEDVPQFRVDIDYKKAAAQGLPVASISRTLTTAWGSEYVDDFMDRGRVKRVFVQADAPFRMLPEDFARWSVRNDKGDMVPFTAFAGTRWDYGSPRLERFNGVSAMEINGEAGAGVSSGDAMAEIERLVAGLPKGVGMEWTGQSYQERAAGAQTPLLYTLSLLVVFLCLAALYESWSIPTAVLMVVPLGILGTVLAAWFRGLDRDVYFQVAMLTTIGLSSKNAILIVEFAKENVEKGMELVAATLHAVRMRLRPILMTSLAFGLGVVPLAISTGAGSGAQRAIGTGVLGGMLVGTFLGIFFTPLFFVLVRGWFARKPGPGKLLSSVAATEGQAGE